jgi:hypothetical protein
MMVVVPVMMMVVMVPMMMAPVMMVVAMMPMAAVMPVPAVVPVAPVAMMPAAVPHHVHGRDLIRRRRDAGAEPGRRRRRELRRGEHQCRPRQNHQNELAHEVSLGCVVPPSAQEAPGGLNSP